jgi:hypothetical protein
MAGGEVEKVHTVYNRTKRPFLDQANQVIIFNGARYHFPTQELYGVFAGRLTNAVDLLWSKKPDDRDPAPLVQVMRDILPYRINSAVGPQYRQQNTIDAVTGEVLN